MTVCMCLFLGTLSPWPPLLGPAATQAATSHGRASGFRKVRVSAGCGPFTGVSRPCIFIWTPSVSREALPLSFSDFPGSGMWGGGDRDRTLQVCWGIEGDTLCAAFTSPSVPWRVFILLFIDIIDIPRDLHF